MRIKHKKKKLSAKKIQRGTVGNFFVFGVLALLVILGITAVGGFPSNTISTNGTAVRVITPTQNPTHNTLQLQTFGYVTLAPTPTTAPMGTTALCKPGGLNYEPEIISATAPAEGQTVSATATITVWVDDEGAPMIAPGETTDSKGAIVNKGNQAAVALDNYLYEPALYLDSYTAESAGSPHFPDFLKGQVNNNPAKAIMTTNLTPVAPIDNPPPGAQTGGCFSSNFFKCYKAEYIWNISSLGLSPGTHRAEFVIHDGDSNRGVGCVNFQVQ